MDVDAWSPGAVSALHGLVTLPTLPTSPCCRSGCPSPPLISHLVPLWVLAPRLYLWHPLSIFLCLGLYESRVSYPGTPCLKVFLP